MRRIDEQTITDAAIEQMSSTADPRLREIMAALVRHLHEFAREVDLKAEEWLEGIRFLKCTEHRQEFILLSDTLGMSSLVNALHDRRATAVGTKTSLLGPFYRRDAPTLPLGASIDSRKGRGNQICVYGRVLNASGVPIPHASVEVWQPDDEGNYDLQRPNASEMDLRGRFFTDDEGRYYLQTVAPCGYMVPMDGPVGDMIRAQRRHGYRPAHIHFLVGAPGYREVVTAIYFKGDEHIESDTVFGVTDSLVIEPNLNDSNSPIRGLPSIRFDFRLASAEKDEMGRVGADPSQIVTAKKS
jgi:hydroxyquinol 1,2-dioxygenase